jgi:isocitrate lyase
MSRAFPIDARAPGNGGGSLLRGRWDGIVRPYSEADVERLRGSGRVEHTLAQMGARRLWDLLTTEHYVNALGAQVISGGAASTLALRESTESQQF